MKLRIQNPANLPKDWNSDTRGSLVRVTHTGKTENTLPTGAGIHNHGKHPPDL